MAEDGVIKFNCQWTKKPLEDGVIKFNCQWTKKPLEVELPEALLECRDEIHRLGLIGIYEDIQIGYGNISLKVPEGMLISGTQTGHIQSIQSSDFALVTTYDMKQNEVTCKGLVKASAESLTHLAFYEADESIKAIIHIHNQLMWETLIDRLPTSDRNVSYGTADMADEIKRLFRQTSIAEDRMMVMGGHEEGLIAFGSNLQEAEQVVKRYLIS
jgi:ribulose-5-phosphate 4-epimerase/fuculose-1-phosphate aldolase